MLGRGFHSDDIRSVSGTVLLEDVPGFATADAVLVKVDSEEVGLRSDLIPLTHIQFAAFLLHVESEQVYDQDQGEDEPARRAGATGSSCRGKSTRPWLEVNADLSYSHARFDTAALAAYGDAGPYIPNAPAFVGSFGVAGRQSRTAGSAACRSAFSAPIRWSPTTASATRGYTETNARIGYNFSAALRAQVDVFNLFDVKANAGAFYYMTVIPGDNGVPTADHQNHPLEPISARFSVTASF